MMTTTTTERPTAQVSPAAEETPAPDPAPIASTARHSGETAVFEKFLRIIRTAAWRSAAIVLFLAIWEVVPVALLSESTRVFLPPLHEVLGALRELIASGELGDDLAASLTRSALGFSIAVVAGIALGLVLSWYRGLAAFLTPLLELFRNTAALALLPVFVLLLGIGETSKVTIVAYASFFPVLLNTIAGATTVDPLLVRAARSLGLTQVRLFQKVILPSAVPTIFTGIRMGGTASILVLIAAEMVGAKAGLGFQIVNAQSSFLIPQMYAGILTVSLLGLVVNSGLVRLEAHFSRWRSFALTR